MSNEVLELFRPEIEKQMKAEIIIKMHKEKIEVLKISKVTGLSEEEIQKIIQGEDNGNT